MDYTIIWAGEGELRGREYWGGRERAEAGCGGLPCTILRNPATILHHLAPSCASLLHPSWIILRRGWVDLGDGFGWVWGGFGGWVWGGFGVGLGMGLGVGLGVGLYCISLCCSVLYCIVLYRIVLYCIVLYCVVLYYIVV